MSAKASESARVRADLVSDDLPRLIAMLYSVLATMDSDSDGWRRYAALIIDAISISGAQPLPRLPLRFGYPNPAAGGYKRFS